MTLKETYAKKAEKVDDVLQKILKKTVGDFTPENVHDIRTSIRRFQSAYKALPKKVRTKRGVRKYKDSCTALFKVLNEMRDYDVILSRLSSYPESNALKDAKSFVRKKREYLETRARKRALSLRDDAKKLKFGSFSDSQFDKRLEVQLEVQARKMRDDLLVVWTGRTKKDELHGLRKDCKKLRYMLELKEEKYGKQMNVLKEWQGYLGTVHDIEMTELVLRNRNKRGSLDSILKEEESKAKENYDKFMTRSRSGETRAVIDSLFPDVLKPQISSKPVLTGTEGGTQTNKRGNSTS